MTEQPEDWIIRPRFFGFDSQLQQQPACMESPIPKPITYLWSRANTRHNLMKITINSQKNVVRNDEMYSFVRCYLARLFSWSSIIVMSRADKHIAELKNEVKKLVKTTDAKTQQPLPSHNTAQITHEISQQHTRLWIMNSKTKTSKIKTQKHYSSILDVSWLIGVS